MNSCVVSVNHAETGDPIKSVRSLAKLGLRVSLRTGMNALAVREMVSGHDRSVPKTLPAAWLSATGTWASESLSHFGTE